MREGTKNCAGKILGAFLAAIAIILAWSCSSPASADMISINVEATSNGESAQYQWIIPEVLNADGHMVWQLSNPMMLTGANGAIGSVDAMTVGFDADPGVSLGFQVSSGASPTLFTISSAIVSFAPLLNPLGYASAGTTLTDVDSNGASLTGAFAGGKAYRAMYDNAPAVDWALLVSSSTAPIDMTVVVGDRNPASGRATILDTVFSIQSQFKFTLSANDQGSGTSRFDIQPAPVPEPGTLMLMGSAALTMVGVVARRRMKG